MDCKKSVTLAHGSYFQCLTGTTEKKLFIFHQKLYTTITNLQLWITKILILWSKGIAETRRAVSTMHIQKIWDITSIWSAQNNTSIKFLRFEMNHNIFCNIKPSNHIIRCVVEQWNSGKWSETRARYFQATTTRPKNGRDKCSKGHRDICPLIVGIEIKKSFFGGQLPYYILM